MSPAFPQNSWCVTAFQHFSALSKSTVAATISACTVISMFNSLIIPNMIRKNILGCLTLLTAIFGIVQPVLADGGYAYCEYVPNDVDQDVVSMPCIFAMRQGAVGITWKDGVYERFVPEDLANNILMDGRGGLVYRDNHAIERGVRFQMEAGIVNVYYGGGSGNVDWGDIDWELAPQTPWGL